MCSAWLTLLLVVGAPSSPVVTSVPQTNSITFSWTQDDQLDVVVTYNFLFEYNGSCSVTIEPIAISFLITTINPTGLISFSNYRLTVTAVNPVGSNTTVVIVTTLPSGKTLLANNLAISLPPPPHTHTHSYRPPTHTHTCTHTLTPHSS